MSHTSVFGDTVQFVLYFCSIRCWFNHYHSLGLFSRCQIGDIFLIFPQKTGFDISCKFSPCRLFAWNVKTCLLGKIRKIFQCLLLKILTRVLSVNFIYSMLLKISEDDKHVMFVLFYFYFLLKTRFAVSLSVDFRNNLNVRPCFLEK